MKRANWCPFINFTYFFQSVSPEKISVTLFKCSIEDFRKNNNKQYNHFGDTDEQKNLYLFNKTELPYKIESVWERKLKKNGEFISENIQLTIPYFNQSYINYEIKSCEGICRYHNLIFIISDERFAVLNVDGSHMFALESFMVSISEYEFEECDAPILLKDSKLNGLITNLRYTSMTYDFILKISIEPSPSKATQSIDLETIHQNDEILFVKTIKELPFTQSKPRSVPIIWKDEFVRNYSKTEMKAVLDVANETYGE